MSDNCKCGHPMGDHHLLADGCGHAGLEWPSLDAILADPPRDIPRMVVIGPLYKLEVGDVPVPSSMLVRTGDRIRIARDSAAALEAEVARLEARWTALRQWMTQWDDRCDYIAAKMDRLEADDEE